jgi:hypothetical protein
MTRWTHDQVTKLAPDASSLAAARRLATPGPWSDTGATDLLLWGKCQGSGKTPYQVSVDLTGPAFKCSCPSRKLPCKHGLALLLLWVDGRGTIHDSATPADFAGDWAATRAAKAATAGAPAADRKPADPEARARRLEERLALMSGGMDDFARWLGDLVRGGTAAARHQPYSWWDATAARLVDAQLPGLAEQVRVLGSEVNARADWADHLLATLGRWWTVTRAWAGRDTLTDDEMGDLRAFLGWPYATEDIRAADAVTDRWLVLGAHRTDDGKLQQQRTWLWGETTHQTLQVLDFAVRGQPLATAKVVGTVLEATLARYPGTTTRRAVFATEPIAVGSSPTLPAGGTLDEATREMAAAAATNPWVARVPVVLESVTATATRLVDAAGHALELIPAPENWLLLALSGGAPVEVFAELEGGRLRPLACRAAGQVHAV